ncbi:MAG: YceI family protein [Streptosporangiales bacterium]|nr:YceI family protein [Streptosporangiales bacterium]MBO0892584.1 YceI family protein [Acidothermales bacterium]
MTLAVAPQQLAPGLVPGTWTIDPVHSEVAFVVRHLVSKVRGTFHEFEGDIVIGETLDRSTVDVRINPSSVNTKNETRDNHLRSADFFEVDAHDALTFRGTGIRQDGDDFYLDGELTIRGTTKPVSLAVEFGGVSPSPFNDTRAGFSATTKINRHDFGVSFNGPVPGSDKAMLGDVVTIAIEVEAVLQDA